MSEEVKTEETLYCECCGCLIDDDDYTEWNGQIICSDCLENHTTTCECCGERIWDEDVYGDNDITLCSHCYHHNYTRCSCCDALLHEDDAYYLDGETYCRDCYEDEREESNLIHEYGYKPNPIFYGEGNRYFGIELEIDGAGRDDDFAEELLDIANAHADLLYIKTDGSLDDGMELVSHPCTMDYHINEFPWEDIMHRAVHQGYRSHQTSTCGLHLHVNRNAFSDSQEGQDEVISRILYFVEHHWNELLKFSRRSEYTMNRWAARYGYEHTPKAIMDKAKKGGNGRYAAVNLCNYHTVEFRLFRGTLKYNTFIATIQLVNRICDAAMYNTDDSIANLGNIKEADMEAVMACEPDIIFIGGRLSKSYDALCEIAPVVFLSTDAEKGVVESTRENAMTIASIFGLEDHVEALMADFDSRIDALKAFAEGKTAIVGMTTSGSFNVLGNDGRCSIIGKEIGFENIGVDANIDTSTHGNEASFEFIVDKNPDYIFAMDRDAAIGTDGAQLAQEILENELVKSTDAYKNGHVVYLAHPNVWYTAEGGIQALNEMLSDLESALL